MSRINSGRRASIYLVIQEQRNKLKSTGAQIDWDSDTSFDGSESEPTADVVIVLSDGILAESLVQIISDQLPQLHVVNHHFPGCAKQFLLITGHSPCLLETAKMLGMKMTSNMTSKQRQSIIKYYLDSLRMLRGEITCSLKTPDDGQMVQVQDGQVVLSRLLDLRHIEAIFPLHDIPALNKLRESWVKNVLSSQPLDDIQSYFGTSIAMYFAYLGHYTCWLTLPSILGLFVQYFMTGHGWSPAETSGPSSSSYTCSILPIFFTLCNLIWSALYIESLRGYSRNLSNKWSLASFAKCGIPCHSVRPQYDGHVSFDVTTGQVKVTEEETIRSFRKWFITYPVIGLSIGILFLITFYLLKFQTYWDKEMVTNRGHSPWTTFIPKILLAIVISFMDSIYYRIAVYLNNKENYAFDSIHESQLVAKLITFQFVSSFLSLLYLTIYVGDVSKLRDQLMTLLITRQVLGNLREAIWPLIWRLIKLPGSGSSDSGNGNKDGNKRCKLQPELECNLDQYKSTFDDYLGMLIQFGHVVLFSPVFPLAATCAIVNNFIEIRSDAFKLTIGHRRPFSGPAVTGITEWLQALNILVYLSIPINCLLLVKTGVLGNLLHQYFGLDDNVHVVLGGVFLEHLMIALKFSCESDKVVPFFNRRISIEDEDKEEDEEEDEECDQQVTLDRNDSQEEQGDIWLSPDSTRRLSRQKND